MFRVKKTFIVAASHRLDLDYKSKCSRRHGHNWTVTVYCQAMELDKNGMVADFAEIKHRIQDKLDHYYLNDILSSNPTAENIAFWICLELDDKHCYRVDVEECPGSLATYIDESLIS
jgi:6-pyruvoyltetrahydropterin/6-carboxytetrahydropterin synthase